MYHLTWNPCARRVRSALFREALLDSFRGTEHHVCPEPAADHLRQVAARGGNSERIVVVGGDGTISRLVGEMGPGCTPVGVVPGGSANDFARRLGIPADPRAASRLAQQGSTRFIEYLMVNGRPLLTGGGVGLPVDIAARAEWWKGSPLRRRIAPGAAAYLAAALYVSARGVLAGWPRASAEIATPGRRRRVEALAILVGTDRTLGRFFRVWPPRELGDTGLGLCVIHGSRSRGGPLRILRLSLAGRLHTDSAVEQSLEAWVRLRFERPQAFLADGEILPPAREFTVRVASRPLEVLGPRGDGRDA